MSRVWSGETYDGQRVIFCDQCLDGFIATCENGRLVVRSLGGTQLGLTYDLEAESVAEWLQVGADRILGQSKSS